MRTLKFVDEVKITVSSGKGGAGAVSFRRERGVPKGGPDGGNGGHGGSIIFTTQPHQNTLLAYQRTSVYCAPHGQPGRGQNQSGAQGEDLILEVPEGTLLKSPKDLSIIKDLKREKDFIFLKGGRGGKGNSFYKSSINQAPTKAQKGESGITKDLLLELQLISDVGLLGFPSVGKSSLISRLSHARPKIAAYPFTTLEPHLGVVDLGENRTLVLADLPGILPGASTGVGLGHQFLRHLKRTTTFLHVLEPSLEHPHRDPLSDYDLIQKELKNYDEKTPRKLQQKPLQKRKQILVLNKCDLLSDSKRDTVVSQFRDKGLNLLPISVSIGYNIGKLVHRLRKDVLNN